MIPEPSPETLAWAAEQVGSGARIDGWAWLAGGSACAIHAVDVVDRGGVRHPLVLKRFVQEDWLQREPDIVAREASHLRSLVQVELPIPRLLAVDADARSCDCPSLLMTRLPGRVELPAPDVGARDLETFLVGLAEPLVVLHAVADELVASLAAYRSYNDLAALDAPAWSECPDLWSRLLARVRQAPPDHRPRFVHRDYHPTNLLWSQGRVSAVLDFCDSSRGPAAADLGHCRLNLAQLCGPEAADRFLQIYEKASAGAIEIDPYWDILSLVEILPGPDEVYPGWRGPAAAGLTTRVIRQRLDAYAERLAKRLA